MKIDIRTKANSFIINEVQYEVGKLPIDGNGLPNIKIGIYPTTLSEITADGQTFASLLAFQTWADSKLF